MANPNKARGTRWESALVQYFNEAHAIPARRVAQSGQLDTGDIAGISPFVGQAKNYRDLTAALRDGVAGARAQAVRAGEEFGVALVKRPGKGTAEGYAVMTVADFARLLNYIQER